MPLTPRDFEIYRRLLELDLLMSGDDDKEDLAESNKAEQQAWRDWYGLSRTCSDGLSPVFTNALDDAKVGCLTCDGFASYRSLVSQAVEVSPITKVVSLGLGRTSCEYRGWGSSQKWLLELACVMATVEMINKKQARPGNENALQPVMLYFQDPDFHDFETNILVALGATVLESPDAKNHVDEKTFVFTLACVSTVFFNFGVHLHPAVFVGNPAALMHKNELYSCHEAAGTDPERLKRVSVHESIIDKAMEEFRRDYRQVRVSDLEMLDADEFGDQYSLGPFFYDTYFYWKREDTKDANEVAEQAYTVLEDILKEHEQSYERQKAEDIAYEDGKDGVDEDQ